VAEEYTGDAYRLIEESLKTARADLDDAQEHLSGLESNWRGNEGALEDATRCVQVCLGKVTTLDGLLKSAVIVDQQESYDAVAVGAHVRVQRDDRDDEVTYFINGVHNRVVEAMPDGSIAMSTMTAVGKALMGHKDGETIVVHPNNWSTVNITILKVW
jgi:transcription elongation GreA/GreB family factor